MKIGYIHLDYEEWTTGNYNVQEIGLAKAFENLGHEIIIVYWVKKSSSKCYTEVNITSKIKKVYLPCIVDVKHHAIFNCNLLKKYGFDLIHLPSDNLFFLPELTSWCKKQKIPFYCYVGTIESSNPNRVQKRLMDFIVKRNLKALKSCNVFTKTPKMLQELEGYKVPVVDVAPVGLDFDVIPKITESKINLKNKLELSLNKKIVLCVSALRESRSPFDIFELENLLNNNCQIVFIGTGPLKDSFIEKLKASSKIKYIEFVKNTKIHEYYSCADYYVNFNSEEIFGMAILEAMYHEVTVVAKKAPGPNLIIEDEISGFLVNNINEMSNIIIKDCRTGDNAKSRILNEFNWGISANKFLKITE